MKKRRETAKGKKPEEKKKVAKKDEKVKGAKGAGATATGAQLSDATELAREKLKKRGKGEQEVEGDEIEEAADASMLEAEVDLESSRAEERAVVRPARFVRR